MSGQKKRRKNCLCCAENIVESIQSKKSKSGYNIEGFS